MDIFMIKGISAVAVAVKDLDEAVQRFEVLLGQKYSRKFSDDYFPFPGIKGLAFDLEGANLYLLSSDSELTSVGRFLKNNGEGIFLITTKTDNIEEDMARMRENEIEFLLQEPVSGQFGTVNFIHPKLAHGVQIELSNPHQKA
jgi:methylmalonyl-CoA epimerase